MGTIHSILQFTINKATPLVALLSHSRGAGGALFSLDISLLGNHIHVWCVFMCMQVLVWCCVLSVPAEVPAPAGSPLGCLWCSQDPAPQKCATCQVDERILYSNNSLDLYMLWSLWMCSKGQGLLDIRDPGSEGGVRQSRRLCGLSLPKR